MSDTRAVTCLEVVRDGVRLGWAIQDDDGGWWALAMNSGVDGLLSMEYNEPLSDTLAFIGDRVSLASEGSDG